jgi:DUF4097 and DUF4098 domain-containing protein YvlB
MIFPKKGECEMKSLQVFIMFWLSLGILFAQDNMERKFDLGSGGKVSIDLNTGGSITITGWDQNQVNVIAAADYDIEEYDIEMRERSRGLSIDVNHTRSGRHSSDIKLILQVPRETNLELETMGGEIRIDNVAGEIEGETMGGDITLANLSGTIELTTMGGEIDVKNSHLDGELKTMGGDITFQDVSGDVNGTTMGGNIKYKGENRAPEGKSGKEVRISTMGGEIRVDEAPGGANVSTMGGDIWIGFAGKNVKAKTMGGDIDVREVDGGFKLSTMGGDITAKMIGDPDTGDRDIDVSSMGGDITVTLPAGLSMSFDVKLTYTKRSHSSHQIISDFPIKTEESEEWEYGDGSPRKHIFGSGEVAGGKYRIKIETINGDIIIKKGK